MINKENFKKIKETIEEFFLKATFDVEVEGIKEEESGVISVSLKAEEPQVLIGEGGQTLAEIQRLLRAILRKIIISNGSDSSEEKEGLFFFNLDINNYRKKKVDYLKEMARNTADEVSLSKKEKALAPMPAFERRIIHMEISNRNDVVSESIGEGLERKLVIKPAP